SAEIQEGSVSSSLDDAVAALPAPDDIFGLALDPAWREVHRYQPTSADGHEVIVSVARCPRSSGASRALISNSIWRRAPAPACAPWRTRSLGPSRTECSASATRSRS